MTRKRTAILLITAAVLTNLGFTALGSIFNYPDVLKEPGREVLERFHEHQGSVATWFAVLAISAALFAPIAIGVGRLRSDRLMRIAVPVGITAAVVQVIGLSRWPILVPGFARDAVGGGSVAVARAVDHFHTVNVVLGTTIGETFGYLLTAAWTVLVAASLGTRFSGRLFTSLGVLSGVMILLGVLSPLDLAAIDTVNFAGYVLWSVWLIWLAVVLLRQAPDPVEPQPSATLARGAVVTAAPELDEVTITIVVDNTTDTLSSIGPGGIPQLPELASILLTVTPMGEQDGHDCVPAFDHLCVACHGFSALATARLGDRSSTALFDVGPSGDVWLANADRLGIDLAAIDVVFLSHWHWDHTGGIVEVVAAIADARSRAGRAPLVVDVHPDRPDQRGILTPLDVIAMLPPEPTIDAIEAAGGRVVAHAEVHEVADLFLSSGDIPRLTDYELGLAGHHSWRGGEVSLDVEIRDERFLAARVRGRGTTVLTACSHAGVVNVGLEARRLLPDQPVDMLLGGYHLAGTTVEDRIEPTVRDLAALVQPRILAPGHCTGWRALAALHGAFEPGRLAPSVVGTRYLLGATD